MPILNLGQIASTATTFAGGRNDWALSEASLYVNLAMFEVASRIQHQPLEALAYSSTTSGGNRIAVPADFDHVIALTIQAGSSSTATSSHATTLYPMKQADARWIDTQALAIGIPESYVPYATWIEVYPSPDSAYTMQLRYRTKIATLVDSTSTPTLDERWHAAVLYKAVELLEASRNNVEGEALARNRYLSYMAGTPTDRALNQRDRTGMTLSPRLATGWPLRKD